MLEDEAVIRSGRELTYSYGKDTGRYWDAGAANVHWVIATDSQVEDGIKNTLGRVQARAVFIEGNSFTKYIEADHFIIVARSDDLKIKSTARSSLGRVSAFYLSNEASDRDRELLKEFLAKVIPEAPAVKSSPVFTRSDLSELIESLARKNFERT
jgi:hypothetical protein